MVVIILNSLFEQASSSPSFPYQLCYCHVPRIIDSAMAHEQTNGALGSSYRPRLIPHVVSTRASESPDKIWASIPISSTGASAGYKDITFAQLNSAVTRAVRWLRENIEPHRSKEFEPLAYIGSPDARYIVFTIAAIKAGFQVSKSPFSR